MPLFPTRAAAAAVLILILPARGVAQEVSVRLSGEHLQISAPKLDFITGKPLERLRNGAAVPFDIQVSVLTDGRQTVLRRSFERFVLSFDLWEEKFSVTRMRSDRASARHLSASAAEKWCLDRFALPVTGLPVDKPVWIRVDVRAQESRGSNEDPEDEVLSLSALIELFSRPARSGGSNHWRAESDPVLLARLKADASP